MIETRLFTAAALMCGWAVLVAFAATADADEGMWLLNNLPKKQLQERYGFEPTPPWVEHVMKSAVRFNSGGSGSFVSSDGLVLTNHHVGADTLHKISTKEHDYYKEGFHARRPEDEPKALDLELNVLQSIEDVTDRVNEAVKSDTTSAEAFAARRAVIATIEKESLDQTGLRSDVVTLYQGGQYQLYRYKKYTDIRLVFAPEFDIAFFGGDPDNFEYPRYDLDICLFRAYENDKPAKIEHFLRWSKAGAADGELVFVAGHPGRTSRLFTVAALKFLRDVRMPFILDLLRRREILYQQFSLKGEEKARIAKEDLFGVQNSRKAYYGMIAGLQDPSLMAKKEAREAELRAKVAGDPDLRRQYGGAWDRIAQAQQEYAKLFRDRSLLEMGTAFNSELFRIARTLVRMAEENEKPNPERLREFSEAARESLLQQLYSSAPLDDDFEITKLSDSLGLLAASYGGDDPLVKKVLAGKSPIERATELISGTRLKDVAERKRLGEAGKSAIADSKDPLIALAGLVDPRARQVRKEFEEKVEEVERQAYAQVAKAIFAIDGTNQYPDATFTLRLSLGTVKGYEQAGEPIPPWTTMGAAFDHAAKHGSREPWQLPESWIRRRENIAAETPFNFVSTCDIIGGNSGSPVMNRNAEFVGIIFDGNVQSLVGDFVYDETQNRAVSVHSASITEALRKIYDAADLADQLGR